MSRIVVLPLLLFACGVETTSALPEPPPVNDEETEWAFPVISRFQPHQGLVGSEVRILGEFGDDLQQVVVTIGGVPAPVQDNEHILTVRVPPEARSGPLCVAADGREDCGESFRVLTSPELYSISPQSVLVGSPDTTVQLNGDGLVPESEVQLNGVSLPVTFRSTNQITVVVPASFLQTAGVAELALMNPDPMGRSWSGVGRLTIANPAPSALSLEPNPFPLGASRRLRVYVRGFVDASVVLIDGNARITTLGARDALAVHVDSDVGPGEHLVQVQNPEPGGGVSAPLVLVVQ